jgi:hypothetical protein
VKIFNFTTFAWLRNQSPKMHFSNFLVRVRVWFTLKAGWESASVCERSGGLMNGWASGAARRLSMRKCVCALTPAADRPAAFVMLKYTCAANNQPERCGELELNGTWRRGWANIVDTRFAIFGCTRSTVESCGKGRSTRVVYCGKCRLFRESH